MKRQRATIVIIGLLVSIVTLWLALKGTDIRQIGNILMTIEPLTLIPIILAYTLHFMLKAHRWQILLRPIAQLGFWQAWHPMVIGYFANNILPAHLGEFVRMYLGARFFSLKSTQVLSSLILERLFDFLVVLTIMGSALYAGAMLPPLMHTAGLVTLVIALGGLIFSLLLGTHLKLISSAVRRLIFFLPQRLKEMIVQQLQSIASGVQAVARPSLLSGIILSSILQWALVGAMLIFTFEAVGLELPLSAAFITLVATVFAVSLPSSPGFFGPLQLAFVLVLSPYGVDEANAIAASIVFHLIMWVYVNIVGIISMWRMGLYPMELGLDAQIALDKT